MKTDDLIALMAADATPARPVAPVLVVSFLAVLGVAGFIFLSVIGMRDDLPGAYAQPLIAAKSVLPVGLALLGLGFAIALARPDGQVRLWPLSVIGVAALGLFALGMLATPTERWASGIVGQTILPCLLSIPALAVVPLGVALVALRRGASTAPRLSGALAGLGAGAAATAVYALHCTEDSPLFYVTWYGLAILLVTALGAALGQRLLRW
ncbi:MAG: DUF1109 domain-containing protein [Pseudomonadota bacterium]